MTLSNKNQNNILNTELINSYNIEYVFSNKPINRINNEPQKDDKLKLLDNLKEKILNIKNCELKDCATQLVFSDGSCENQIMIVGEGPGQKEDELGKPFVGDAGNLLNKMLKAINVDRKKIYITNVVNYRPPNNRKPESAEIIRYSNFLREHISIIKPKILILMGSTALESLFGPKIRISKERGIWKEIIINDKTYLTLATFHPAYLLRQADQKKYSWLDLKKIRKKIDELGLKI